MVALLEHAAVYPQILIVGRLCQTPNPIRGRRPPRRTPYNNIGVIRGDPSMPQPTTRGEASSGGGEADDLLFGPDGERAFCRRQESFLDIFPGAGNKIAAATQVELALNIFAMALNCFYTEMK